MTNPPTSNLRRIPLRESALTNSTSRSSIDFARSLAFTGTSYMNESFRVRSSVSAYASLYYWI
jgi:hypothetical protein